MIEAKKRKLEGLRTHKNAKKSKSATKNLPQASSFSLEREYFRDVFENRRLSRSSELHLA